MRKLHAKYVGRILTASAPFCNLVNHLISVDRFIKPKVKLIKEIIKYCGENVVPCSINPNLYCFIPIIIGSSRRVKTVLIIDVVNNAINK